MADLTTGTVYEDLLAAAETYRAALVVRLAGEAGLRTGEITRIRPRDLRESERVSGAGILSIPAADDGEGTNGTTVERETVVERSLRTELRRYADAAGVGDEEPLIDVSSRRVQMLVSETADRAAMLSDDPSLASMTPRDLRRRFTRRLLERGVDAHVVREAGGWTSMAALDPYLDPLSGEAIAEAVSVADEGREESFDAGETLPSRAAKAAVSGSADGWETLLDAFASIPTVTDRDVLFTTVLERVTAGDRWRTAWIVRGGTADDFDGAVAAAATNGTETDRPPLPAVPDVGTAPWRTALGKGAPVVRRVDDAGLIAEGADRAGNGAVLAVPVAQRDATYGALCLRSRDPEPVSDAERQAVAVLGRCLGWGVTAGRWRDLLHSDAVTEVEFRTAADDALLTRLSNALDCRIELESAVTTSGASTRCYLRVFGAGPRAFADAVRAGTGASEPRVVETHENGCTVSIGVSDGSLSLVRSLTERGATVRDAAAADGRVRVIADLPDGTDVGSIADGVRRTHPGVRLVRKESVTRSSHTESTLRDGVTERLTERQWATLSAAYHSGYFDWPRGSTAEEVADSMDVSSPTFHNHLRKAQRALLDTLFESENDQ